MGLMGTAGMLSISWVLPELGRIYDAKKIEYAGGEAQFNALVGAAKEQILGAASQISFRYVAVLPLVLLVVFGAIWQYERSRGGYKPEAIKSKAFAD